MDEVFSLCLPLKTTKEQEDILNKRLSVCCEIYNDLQRKMLRKFIYVKQMKAYKELTSKIERGKFVQRLYGNATKNGIWSPLFSDFGFKKYISKFKDKGSDIGINSKILENIAGTAWSAWDKLLFHKGKRISFKNKCDYNSYKVRVSNKCVFIGMNTDNLLTHNIIGININGKIGKKAKYINIPFNVKTQYEKECLQNELREIGIKRVLIRGKWKYFITFVLKGTKPQKERKLGKGRVGIDIGPSTIAVCSDDVIYLDALAKDIVPTEEKRKRLMRKLDRSRRVTNPLQFNENGTIRRYKKGERPQWILSNHYKKIQTRVRELYRKESVKRKNSHIELSNMLLSLGDDFVVENNPYAAWMKKAKEITLNKKKRINSKKRFGKSIGNHAPAMFITILENKVKSLGGNLMKVNISNAASQFDFSNETFTRHELKERRITISNGNTHLRDVLAAYNLQHIIGDKTYDVNTMKEKYEKFIQMEQEEIQRHQILDEKIHSTFGIRKTSLYI